MRVDKMISAVKVDSRKNIKKNAKKGELIVNGEIIKDSSYKVDPYKDEVIYMGEYVEYFENLYIMMNKPKGVISSTNDLETTVIDLLDYFYQRFDFNLAGRLDKDTTGLIILSTDGKLIHEIISPNKDIYKKYEVLLKNKIVDEDVDRFKEGIEIKDGNYITKPAKLEVIDDNRCYVYISEGKFHQVKNMFKALSNEVLELKRLQIGQLELDPLLKEGEYRELSEYEIDMLKNNQHNFHI
ncbi:MAG: pseudouridine synthase [Tissierellia bacterium]|nr:pseudouridine synthase [Tissierellia bacterium]